MSKKPEKYLFMWQFQFNFVISMIYTAYSFYLAYALSRIRDFFDVPFVIHYNGEQEKSGNEIRVYRTANDMK